MNPTGGKRNTSQRSHQVSSPQNTSPLAKTWHAISWILIAALSVGIVIAIASHMTKAHASPYILEITVSAPEEVLDTVTVELSVDGTVVKPDSTSDEPCVGLCGPSTGWLYQWTPETLPEGSCWTVTGTWKEFEFTQQSCDSWRAYHFTMDYDWGDNPNDEWVYHGFTEDQSYDLDKHWYETAAFTTQLTHAIASIIGWLAIAALFGFRGWALRLLVLFAAIVQPFIWNPENWPAAACGSCETRYLATLLASVIFGGIILKLLNPHHKVAWVMFWAAIVAVVQGGYAWINSGWGIVY